MATPNTKPHVVIIPSPGMGHLIPLVEFAHLLHFNHHFSITLLIPSSAPPTTAQTSFLATLPPAISHTYLPLVDPTLLPQNVDHEVIIDLIHKYSLPSFKSTLASLLNVVAVITDLFGTDYFDIAREHGIPPYMYFTTNAFCLLFFLHFPRLHETISCEFREMRDPIVLPGCVPLYGKDFVDPAQDRQGESYKVLLYHVNKYTFAEGIFINTFLDLEPTGINALRAKGAYLTEFYSVGPVIQSGLGCDANQGLECLAWLDKQPLGSVLFVSFGSGGTLSHEQITELALGLEKSGQKFLWVVRAPSDTSHGSFFTQGGGDNPFRFLPEGYLDRIKDQGLLVPSWVPQIKVLSHGSTGGFLTHCGWNSTLESIVNGVPLIAWPLYAEQRMNAVLLNEGLKVALRPKKCAENGIVKANEIARVVKKLMEGEEGKKVGQRMKEYSELAKKTRSQDGDSTLTLNKVAQEWSLQ